MSSSDRSVTTNGTASNDDVATCPLCAESGSELGDIYQHLMVNHRKSELSRLVLAFGDTNEPLDSPSDELHIDGERDIA